VVREVCRILSDKIFITVPDHLQELHPIIHGPISTNLHIGILVGFLVLKEMISVSGLKVYTWLGAIFWLQHGITMNT
jgi:hypothetical protein